MTNRQKLDRLKKKFFQFAKDPGPIEAGGKIAEKEVVVNIPVDTGAYKASVNGRLIQTKNQVTYRVSSSGIPYAVFVEFGTSRMAPRPAFRQAFTLPNRLKIRKKVKQQLQRSLNQTIR